MLVGAGSVAIKEGAMCHCAFPSRDLHKRADTALPPVLCTTHTPDNLPFCCAEGGCERLEEAAGCFAPFGEIESNV